MPSSQLLDLKVVATSQVFSGVPLQKLKQWAGEGRIASHDLVRPSGSAAWKEVSDVPHLAELLRLPAAKQAPAKPTPSAAPQTKTDPRWQTAETAGGVSQPKAAADRPPGTSTASPIDTSFGSRRLRRRRKAEIEEVEMDMTPMIDVTFQLLIFFMFANQLANPVPIVVPEATYGRGVTPDGKQMILIDEEAHYYLGDSTKPENISPSLDDLVGEVRGNASVQGESMDVIINAHKASKHVDLRLLIDRLDDIDDLGKVLVGVSEKQ